MKKFLIAGNWKMNLKAQDALGLTTNIIKTLKEQRQHSSDFDARIEYLVCPSFVYLQTISDALRGHNIALGAQDCSAEDQGAHTGDVAADMLVDCGCDYVILGHSERRADHKESSALIAQKAKKAHENGLKAIICVGETLEEREAGDAKRIVGEQLEKSLPNTARPENTVIAYEPVWAIGTGNTASADDVKEMHSFIAEKLNSMLEFDDAMRIIYGGSVKPSNAFDLMGLDHVSGALIGGASLKAEDFTAIASEAYKTI
jgi:triosephosphate isomerase